MHALFSYAPNMSVFLFNIVPFFSLSQARKVKEEAKLEEVMAGTLVMVATGIIDCLPIVAFWLLPMWVCFETFCVCHGGHGHH